MAKHRAISDGSKRARTIVGGVIAGGALLAAAPMALASAQTDLSTQKGNAVGRPGLQNPAPVVRTVQTVGDTIFHSGDTDGAPLAGKLQNALNDGPIGQAYHTQFGTAGDFDADGNYIAGTGTNGKQVGILNATNLPKPGVVYANTVNIQECQIVTASDGVPRGLQTKAHAEATGSSCSGGGGGDD